MSNRPFTLHEAKELLPVVKRITNEAVEQVENLKVLAKKTDSEPEFAKIIDHWAKKIAKLGCEPKGLWLVDFDNGSGYYCWHHPEEDVEFFHNYDGGFKGRTPIL